MPLHFLQYPNLLGLLSFFSATATVLIPPPFVLQFIFFAFIFTLFLFVLVLPFLCTLISSRLILKAAYL
jgi:hypothetical protein